MSAETDHGGMAFPQPGIVTWDKEIGGFRCFNPINGMFLDDYFAGEVLRGYIQSLDRPIPEDGWAMPEKDLVAQVCYEFADAMIRVRKKRQCACSETQSC